MNIPISKTKVGLGLFGALLPTDAVAAAAQHKMKLHLYYENVARPLTIDIPDNEVNGFLQEYEEALHDTSVESFQWKGSGFRIGGLLAIVQECHASLS